MRRGMPLEVSRGTNHSPAVGPTDGLGGGGGGGRGGKARLVL